MAKELDLQTKIKNSVRQDGGYSFKLSNRFTIGIPDLVIALPPFAPGLWEVKDLGPCPENFSRQLDVTPKQRHELNRMGEPYDQYGPVCGLLVGLQWRGEHLLVALPRLTERLAAPLPVGPMGASKRGKGGYYAIAPLFEQLGVPKL